MLHTEFQATKPSGSEEKSFEYFSLYFYDLNLSLAQVHLGTWDLHLNKLGKGPLGNATYQFYASKQSGFLNIFLCISLART